MKSVLIVFFFLVNASVFAEQGKNITKNGTYHGVGSSSLGPNGRKACWVKIEKAKYGLFGRRLKSAVISSSVLSLGEEKVYVECTKKTNRFIECIGSPKNVFKLKFYPIFNVDDSKGPRLYISNTILSWAECSKLEKK